ncbi:MAG: hypothetical protein LKG14_04065 [Prevotella sp.]|nr:hypothetical protein [Prevotella sp.]
MMDQIPLIRGREHFLGRIDAYGMCSTSASHMVNAPFPQPKSMTVSPARISKSFNTSSP